MVSQSHGSHSKLGMSEIDGLRSRTCYVREMANIDNKHRYDMLQIMVVEAIQIALGETSMTENLVERIEEIDRVVANGFGLTSSGHEPSYLH